jgi:hypothetical protein
VAVNDATPPRLGALKNQLRYKMRTTLGQRLRVLLQRFFRLVLAAAAAMIAIAGGVLSSRHMINQGSPLSTITYGPWVYWKEAGREGADPYTRAHVAKSGTLRFSSDTAGVYETNSDAQGAYLHSSCDYIIEGPYAQGLWWSLSVFDSRGLLIANDAERYAFTSDTVAANPDGSYIVTLGRDARPGNWLPTGGAGRITVVFTLLDPASGLSEEQRAERYKVLPDIRREGCS